jgi:hypothetical protein
MHVVDKQPDMSAQVESSWNVNAHGDAREGEWRGNWRMKWIASTLHTTSELGVSSITTADAYTLAASSWLNWSPRRIKWTRPFRRKTKSGFCACAITFQTQSNKNHHNKHWQASFAKRLSQQSASLQNQATALSSSKGNVSDRKKCVFIIRGIL